MTDARLYTDVPVDDPTLGPNEKIRFSKAPFPPTGLRPSSEDSLRAWVLSMVGRPGPFARCYRPEVEYRIPGRKRFIDLLLHERGNAGSFGGFVIVEFEASAPAGTVAQTLDYMRAFRSTKRAAGKDVRGVIVCAHDHPKERALLSRIDEDIRWYVLDARLEDLTPESSRTRGAKRFRPPVADGPIRAIDAEAEAGAFCAEEQWVWRDDERVWAHQDA